MTVSSTLARLAAEAAAGLGDVEASSTGGGVEYAVGGRVFAAVEGTALEVDLGQAVAAAAVRTPDVRRSGRGAGWVRFDPRVLDQFARDRAIAWLGSAHRRAAAGRDAS